MSILATLMLASSALAASTCLQGSLSPNGVPGNFNFVSNRVVFDPSNLAIGFNVQLQSCTGTTSSSVSGHLMAPNGQCLAVENSQIIGVDCGDSALSGELTWTFTSGFLFWSGPMSTCSSGLYGYEAASGGAPIQSSPTPVTIICDSAPGAFPFSLLI